MSPIVTGLTFTTDMIFIGNTLYVTDDGLSALGPGKLVVRDRNMPGWTAWVEGRETPIAGTTWREVDIPSGAHNVLFTYEPPGIRLGVWLATAAIALMGLSVAAARLTERSRQALGS